MKNEEIEELLNEMKDKECYYVGTNGCLYQDLERKEINLLLSYIEQLEEKNDRLKKDYAIVINDNCDYITLEKKIEQLEKRNKELYEGFMATQEELTDYAMENEKLEKRNESLLEDRKQLLNLVEQLEKENKILRENAENNDKVVDKVNWENKQLKNNRDKAIRTLETLKGSARWERHLYDENQQLKKQKDDVVEYIKSNCIVSDEWTELDFCNFVPSGKINYKALNKEKVKDLLRMLGEIE